MIKLPTHCINTYLIEILQSISDVELNLPKGVYLFLGYSEKDEKLLKAVTDQGAEEARGAIQGMVSFHNVNNNKVKTMKYQPGSSIIHVIFNS